MTSGRINQVAILSFLCHDPQDDYIHNQLTFPLAVHRTLTTSD